ncbi:hypothetical protein ALI144C_31435 [Actinosynnema sp. ALI-1.44]|nr:hypothetical protein ALI144C_31435 [Actinosynnema sp. ALI-1.44]
MALPEMSQILPLVYGFTISQIAGTTARLGVADLVQESPKTAAELTAAVGADPNYFSQLLRAAVAVGMLTRDQEGRYTLTPVGRIFGTDSPWQAKVHDAWHTHPAVWQAFGALEDAVRQGRPAFEIVHNTSFFDYIDSNAELAALFHSTMSTNTHANNATIVTGYDFSHFTHIVDIGGGNGALLSAILNAHKHLHATLFDTTSGVHDAPTVLAAAGVTDRCEITTGDFRRSVPTGADAYLLKNVIHDWDDESCVTILRNCRNAMAPGGRIVVFGSVMPEQETADPADALSVAIQDVAIMAICSGSTRSIAEHEALFARAGLKLAEVTPLHHQFLFHAFEAVPV